MSALPPRPEPAGYRDGCPSCERARLMAEPACVRDATDAERAWVHAYEDATDESFYWGHWPRWLAFQSHQLF